MSAGPTARPAAAPAAPSVQPVPATPAAAPPPGARRRRLVAVVATALAVAGAVTAGAYGVLAVASAGGHAGAGGLLAPGPPGPGPVSGDGAPAVGPGPVTVHVAIEHSRFTLDAGPLRVVAGTEVRFVVGNGDPIGHELIVGPPEVHARHASGTHAAHGAVPGEVSVAPGAEGVTTFVFDDPGTVEYACHLAGHYDHGMHGEIEVVPA